MAVRVAASYVEVALFLALKEKKKKLDGVAP